MSFELPEALKAALDEGCSFAELEATLLADGDTDDQIAAAWLYAWAYDATRPQRDKLSARITNRPARDQAPKRRVILDAALDRSVVRGTLTAATGERREFHGCLELHSALEAVLGTGAHDTLNRPDASVVVTEGREVRS